LVTVFLLSLAGIPPTAGFLGRYFIVRGLVESKHILLAWFLAFSSLALAYCYLRVAFRVWKKTAAQVLPLPLYGMMTAMLAVCLFVSLAAGIYAEPFTRLARYALGQ
jgi:NADH-quinone oxidoreductase subunit N